jgi:hypothetical protein
VKADVQRIYAQRAQYRADIPLFSRRVLKIDPDPAQEKALRDFQESGRIAVKAGHGVGKTVVMVILLYHQLVCYSQSMVPCTAPSLHQLRDILWTEAARWRSGNAFLTGFFEFTGTRIAVRGYANTWFAVAIPSTNPDNLAGLHDKNLLYLVDEAPGIKEPSWAVIEGALTRPGNKVAMIGNPTRTSGYFANAFGKGASEWRTSTISCLHSRYADPKYAARIARTFGQDSNIYRVRVLGEFPLGEDDAILPMDLVSQAMERGPEEVDPADDAVELGCDVARYGDDRTEIYVRRGMAIIDHREIVHADTVAVAAECLSLCRKWAPRAAKIDQTGVGSGVVDSLADMIRRNHLFTRVVGVDFGQSAVDSATYENAATEMLFNLREVLPVASIPNDVLLQGELTMRKYSIHRTSGRLVAQPKEELRKDLERAGAEAKSPDKADALALCFYQANGNSGGGKVRVFRREMAASRY